MINFICEIVIKTLSDYAELLMTMTMVDLLTSRTWSTSEFWSSEFRILVMGIRNSLSSHRIYVHIDFYYHFGSP